MQPLTVRLSDETRQYLKECAKDSGVSMNVVVETLLDAARRRGWRVSSLAAQVREPE